MRGGGDSSREGPLRAEDPADRAASSKGTALDPDQIPRMLWREGSKISLLLRLSRQCAGTRFRLSDACHHRAEATSLAKIAKRDLSRVDGPCTTSSVPAGNTPFDSISRRAFLTSLVHIAFR